MLLPPPHQIAGFTTAAFYICILLAAKYISGAEVGLCSLLESVVGPFWVFIGMGEVPTLWTFIGGSLLLGTLLGHALFTSNAIPLDCTKAERYKSGTIELRRVELRAPKEGASCDASQHSQRSNASSSIRMKPQLVDLPCSAAPRSAPSLIVTDAIPRSKMPPTLSPVISEGDLIERSYMHASEGSSARLCGVSELGMTDVRSVARDGIEGRTSSSMEDGSMLIAAEGKGGGLGGCITPVQNSAPTATPGPGARWCA